MPAGTESKPPRRADAERNREKILAAARPAFAESDAAVSMAEVSRRAGVGMATLYRNFPGRRELLEALYAEEVDALCASAAAIEAETPGAVFAVWLRRFFDFFNDKRPLGDELLKDPDGRTGPFFDDNRSRILSASDPLLKAARRSGEVRDDVTLDQILGLVIGIAKIGGDDAYREPILRVALDGLRPPGQGPRR